MPLQVSEALEGADAVTAAVGSVWDLGWFVHSCCAATQMATYQFGNCWCFSQAEAEGVAEREEAAPTP